jgi:hypothetical protein
MIPEYQFSARARLLWVITTILCAAVLALSSCASAPSPSLPISPSSDSPSLRVYRPTSPINYPLPRE